MRIEGKLVKIFDLETGVSKAGKEWKKQSILIEQNTEYNKEIVISYFGDNVNKLSSINIGDNLSCSINLSSREYNGKWYHNIDGWTCALANGNTVKPEEDLPF
tara:strand:+ start:81 stop:389 length:309 start_codon:yes stop_codon:yes gene_type:complete